MTQTTTELLDKLRSCIAIGYRSDAVIYAEQLDELLASGEPIPDQWLGKSDRYVVEAWAMNRGDRCGWRKASLDSDCGFATVKLNTWQITFVPQYFRGNTPDEAYALAAKWCKEQP
jgi:hypothetical protein